jgi:hypothetical protein
MMYDITLAFIDFFTASQCYHLIKSVNIDHTQVKRAGGYAFRSLALGHHRK